MLGGGSSVAAMSSLFGGGGGGAGPKDIGGNKSAGRGGADAGGRGARAFRAADPSARFALVVLPEELNECANRHSRGAESEVTLTALGLRDDVDDAAAAVESEQVAEAHLAAARVQIARMVIRAKAAVNAALRAGGAGGVKGGKSGGKSWVVHSPHKVKPLTRLIHLSRPMSDRIEHLYTTLKP